MNRSALNELLEKVAKGGLTPEKAAEALVDLPFEDLGFANLDHHRHLRNGFPEVVFGLNKTAEQIAALALALNSHGAHALVTRVSPEKAEAVRRAPAPDGIPPGCPGSGLDLRPGGGAGQGRNRRDIGRNLRHPGSRGGQDHGRAYGLPGEDPL